MVNQGRTFPKGVFSMTRREEIVTSTLGCRQSYADLKRPITPDDVADAFEKGAYWADKTMIEKACEWLEQNAVKYESGTRMGYIPFNMIEDMINDFKQAMEE